LVVITCAPNFETQKYLALKQKKARALGIDVTLQELPVTSTTEEVQTAVREAVTRSNGVIVQLPLPAAIDTVAVLSAIPASHDVDAFSYAGEVEAVLPPVVGAIDLIARAHNVSWVGKRVAVFGQGRLVGAPAAAFAKAAGAEVSILTEASTDSTEVALTSDIIILGVGKPNLLTPSMVKEGVVVFDAGASEDGGLLVGDADPSVANKAGLFTPVPGGIGPMTIALLFHNLVELQKRQ
jgi:methylenetetrahydrofolate dehydrogenase (NADP+)/methenyltetrahydrofolate cyclohydrolase